MFTFPQGGYRIQTVSPSPAPAALGNGRTGSLRATSYTNFYLSVDLVDWDDSFPQAAGLLARIGAPGLGTTTGYALTYSNDRGPDDGVLDITKITGEIPDDVPTSGNDHYRLVPGRKYRLVFIGQGTRLEGRLYELPDTVHPLRTIIGFDSTWTSGVSGLIVYDNSDLADNLTDATFDNFVSHDIEPPRLEISGPDTFGDITLSWPASYLDAGFKLEWATSPASPTWNVIPNEFTIINPPAPKPRPTIRWSLGWGKSSTDCAVRKPGIACASLRLN